MRGGKVLVGEPPTHQTVLVAGAVVDVPSFPGENPVMDRDWFVDAMDPCAPHVSGYFRN